MSNHIQRILNRVPPVPPVPTTPDPVGVRFKMEICILNNGQTRLTAPLNNPKVCMALLAEAAQIIQSFSPTSDAEAQASGLIVQPEKKIILPNG